MSLDASHPNSSASKSLKMHRRLVRWEDTCCLAEVCELDPLLQAVDALGLTTEIPPVPSASPPDISLGRYQSAYLLTVGVREIPVTEADRLAHYLAVTIPWTFFRLSPNPVLHASSCVVDDQAVLFCGRSETGKSSLAAAAWELGLSVMSDDCTVVDPERLLVRPFPQGFSLRLPEPVVPEPFTRLADQGSRYFLGKGLKSENWVLFGRSLPGFAPYGLNLPVKALYLIRRGASTRRSPVDRQKALRSILAQTFPGQVGALTILPFIEALMSQGKIHELEVGEGDVSGAVAMVASP